MYTRLPDTFIFVLERRTQQNSQNNRIVSVVLCKFIGGNLLIVLIL